MPTLKDLTFLGELGRPGVGYAVAPLAAYLEEVLGIVNSVWVEDEDLAARLATLSYHITQQKVREKFDRGLTPSK